MNLLVDIEHPKIEKLLLRAGVPARGRVVLGTSHGAELMGIAAPDISRDTAASIAHFAREVTA